MGKCKVRSNDKSVIASPAIFASSKNRGQSLLPTILSGVKARSPRRGRRSPPANIRRLPAKIWQAGAGNLEAALRLLRPCGARNDVLSGVLIFLILFTLPLGNVGICLASTDTHDLNVDGTMYDRDNPQASVAMINGQPYKVGDIVGEFNVIDIYANGVKLKHVSTGEEKSLIVGVEPSEDVVAEEEVNAAGSGVGKFFSGLFQGKGASDIGLRPALQGLRKAIMDYRSELGRFPESLAILVQEGRINPSVVHGVGDYEFSYERIGQTFTLYAEPRSASEEAFHYYMDDIGRLRSEKGRRADEKSEIVEL